MSVGVCFEGNYETTTSMPDAQLNAGLKLVEYIKGKYPGIVIKGHKDFSADTVCPGKYFPMDKFV
jgi:N-acetylmuramoyl-L-alanine amidase